MTSAATTMTESTSSQTTTVELVGQQTSSTEEAVLRLQLSPQVTRANDPRVRWAAETVDNEHMGRQKSKCCCIYKKKRKWDESSSDESDSDCETDHCRGHVEKKGPPPPEPKPSAS